MSCLFFLSCNQDDYRDASTEENLTWLEELIENAKNDETGNYTGFIWLVQHDGQDFYVTNMMLGSGGILRWVFDCSGRHYAPRGTDVCPACEFVGNKHFYVDDDDYLLPPNFDNVEKKVVYAPSFIR